MCPKTQQGKYYCVACSVHYFLNGCMNNELMETLKTPSCPSDPFLIRWEGRDLAEETPTRTILVLSFNFPGLLLLLLCFGFNLVCCFLRMQGPWALRRACQVVLDLLHWGGIWPGRVWQQKENLPLIGQDCSVRLQGLKVKGAAPLVYEDSLHTLVTHWNINLGKISSYALSVSVLFKTSSWVQWYYPLESSKVENNALNIQRCGCNHLLGSEKFSRRRINE